MFFGVQLSCLAGRDWSQVRGCCKDCWTQGACKGQDEEGFAPWDSVHHAQPRQTNTDSSGLLQFGKIVQKTGFEVSFKVRLLSRSSSVLGSLEQSTELDITQALQLCMFLRCYLLSSRQMCMQQCMRPAAC